MLRLIHTLRFILNHPLNDSVKRKWAAIKIYFRWQISSRLALGPTLVPFVNGTQLIVTSGMTGATGNIYVGLNELSDCAFVLHLLRPSDLFIDIGANVGTYTVLASGAVGAHTVSIEPIAPTFAKLCANLRVNNIVDRVTCCNVGLGRTNDKLRFTTDIDTGNHIVDGEDFDGATILVAVRPLDEIVGDEAPTLIKMDVEGWESEVLAGAQVTLKQPSLLGLIVEMNSNGKFLNENEQAVDDCLRSHGFAPHAYAPFARKLTPLASKNQGESNTIYLRNVQVINERLSTAPPFHVNGRQI
jgi:FkbM family methyltransferase